MDEQDELAYEILNMVTRQMWPSLRDMRCRIRSANEPERARPGVVISIGWPSRDGTMVVIDRCVLAQNMPKRGDQLLAALKAEVTGALYDAIDHMVERAT